MNDHTTETALSLLYRYGLPEDVIDGALCLHAQELAAKIRTTDLPDWFTDVDLFENGVGWAADLITPGRQAADAQAAVRPPATDRTALREQIAAALYALMLRNGWDGERTEPVVREMDLVLDAVLAVLPEPADRAAVLAEAIGALEAERDATDVNVAVYPRYDAKGRMVLESAISVLRRLAAEPAAAGPDQTRETPDTLPAWLYQRFMQGGEGWDNLDDDQRAYWEHEARAVRRAVERGGFRVAVGGAQQQTEDRP